MVDPLSNDEAYSWYNTLGSYCDKSTSELHNVGEKILGKFECFSSYLNEGRMRFLY